jgi:hypothetical protein
MSATYDAVSEHADDFDWKTQPVAARWVTRAVDALAARNPVITRLASELHEHTGTRLIDWIDHFALCDTDSLGLIGELADVGYRAEQQDDHTVWRHTLGMFPPVIVNCGRTGLAIRCECAEACLTALPATLGLKPIDQEQIIGVRGGTYRHALVDGHADAALWIVERHGYDRFGSPQCSHEQIAAARQHLHSFRSRQRNFEQSDDGFNETQSLFKAAAEVLGTDWACNLFFTAEREYWQGRNHAGAVQYERQNRLGLGWANHDHHTYRSSRSAFPQLIGTLELMGFQCRERFYAGREAGWGAQVIEQPQARVVIFADVDLSPEEVADDFAHQALPARDHLGTVGLWCELHGEAFFQAGMHHLEAQFDFDAARDQLAAVGVETMAPFTYFPHLKQAFTRGETWQIDPRRCEHLLCQGLITPEQCDRFRHEGALGSHLEILERNDGYKGFNQTGISEIITRTDPRRVAVGT